MKWGEGHDQINNFNILFEGMKRHGINLNAYY